MPELIVLVLDSSDQIPGVLEAWIAAGVSGVTSIDSSGLGHHINEKGFGGDLPLGDADRAPLSSGHGLTSISINKPDLFGGDSREGLLLFAQ
ncbi:MAG TPA: hypothetical protein PK954_19425, partial [Anaerolineales bacterium]|nr:hypothetical protein [Anaerolineales bacterium]